MTGVPKAMASIMISPNGSGQLIGNRKVAACERKGCLPLSFTSPIGGNYRETSYPLAGNRRSGLPVGCPRGGRPDLRKQRAPSPAFGITRHVTLYLQRPLGSSGQLESLQIISRATRVSRQPNLQKGVLSLFEY
jgi:hypothetical protein